MTKYERPRLIDLSDAETGYGICETGDSATPDDLSICIFGIRVRPDCRSGHLVVTGCIPGGLI